MAAHPLYREIATETAQLVLEKRRRLGELQTPAFDNTHCVLKTVSGYHPRLFVADVDEGTDSANPNPPERMDHQPSPTWHWHGRKARKG